MVMYRNDLFEKAGLTMPEEPTWDFVGRRGAQDHRQVRRRLRHLPARQGRLGREHGVPDRDVQLLRRALVRRELAAAVRQAGMEERRFDFYVDLMKDAGPPGASSNGFNENLALFNPGKCGMWIDATVAASFVTNPEGLQGRRQGRLRARAECGARQARQLAVGVESSPSRPARRRPTPRRSSSPGRPARTTPSSSPRRKAGPTCRPARAPRSTRIRNT